MSLTRKQFLRRGLFSLGSAALELAGGLRGEASQALAAQPSDGAEPESLSGPEMVAVPRPALCLARGCGCFCCLERCESGAISLVSGRGVEVDAALCTGCGTCCSLCPTTPKAIALIRREQAAGA